MYSIDLRQISLDEFEDILTTIELSPGRRMLLDDLAGIIGRLKQRGIAHLADLQAMLRDKKRYPQLADELSVSPDYLVVLNREINGYVSRPEPLSKLEVFSAAELERLAAAGMKTTQDLYACGLTPAARQALAARLALAQDQLDTALELADLLRINGVGPVFARILRIMGIRGAASYLRTDSQQILDGYQRLNGEKGYTKARLGIRDVEYCKRFCAKLDPEIEW